MDDLPRLIPAFSIRMQTSPQLIMGKTFSNSGMAVGPIEHGTVTSVPGYGAEPFEGEAVNEADVFYVDAAFRGVKLDFRSVIRLDKSRDGEAIYFSFLGFIEGNEDTALILRGHPDAKLTQFGSSHKFNIAKHVEIPLNFMLPKRSGIGSTTGMGIKYVAEKVGGSKPTV